MNQPLTPETAPKKGMSTVVKVLLGCGVGLLLLFGSCVVVTGYFAKKTLGGISDFAKETGDESGRRGGAGGGARPAPEPGGRRDFVRSRRRNHHGAGEEDRQGGHLQSRGHQGRQVLDHPGRRDDEHRRRRFGGERRPDEGRDRPGHRGLRRRRPGVAGLDPDLPRRPFRRHGEHRSAGREDRYLHACARPTLRTP